MGKCVVASLTGHVVGRSCASHSIERASSFRRNSTPVHQTPDCTDWFILIPIEAPPGAVTTCYSFDLTEITIQPGSLEVELFRHRIERGALLLALALVFVTRIRSNIASCSSACAMSTLSYYVTRRVTLIPPY